MDRDRMMLWDEGDGWLRVKTKRLGKMKCEGQGWNRGRSVLFAEEVRTGCELKKERWMCRLCTCRLDGSCADEVES